MPKERTNLYITERQKKQLQKRSEEENLPIAELIRRAIDVYLAWDDPNYQPDPNHPKQGRALSSPA